MDLIKRAAAWFLALVMVLALVPQTVFAEEMTSSSLQYEVLEETNEDKTETAISLKFTETETIQLKKITLPDGTERTEELFGVTYIVTENGSYDFKVDYFSGSDELEETITVEVSELEEKKTEIIADQGDELNVDIQLKGATYFDGTPWSGTTQKILKHKKDVPYNGWQLMQLTVEIPYQEGLEVNSITPNAEGVYPELSLVEKDDKKSLWTYDFYFYNNGTYEFTIDYTLNGENKTTSTSFTVDGLVSIKNAAMRRHLIHNYGEFSGFSHQGGQYITEDFLSRPLYDPWGNLSFDFGKDTDNGSTAQYTTSLDGLQYLTNIHGMDLYICQSLVPGETIAPVTQGYYPKMTRFRVSNINERPKMPLHAYNGELVAQCIANMPALQELVMNGVGFSDCTVFRKLTDGNLYYLQAMANNIVSLDGIESQPNLSNVNIGQNKIKSIEPLSKLNQIDLVNLNYNQVFDLKPLNLNLDKDARFAGNYQEITYDRTVISPLQNGVYTVELPMPIDIDGTLTDTASVNVQYKDGNSKTYNTTKSEGKTYISIPESDVDSGQENPFEGAEFKFSFNNNNGTDSRTKGEFNGNLTFKASPIATKYHVVYDFVSGTAGQTLPTEVTDLLPIDPTQYEEGQTVNAIQPGQTTVTVGDGVWTFEGYDANSMVANDDNVNENGDIQFTGTWTFTKTQSPVTKKYPVDYGFISGTTDQELPQEVLDLLPNDPNQYDEGQTILAIQPAQTIVTVADGVWTFQAYDAESKIANADNVNDKGAIHFTGTWEFKENASIINQIPTINASDKTINVGDKYDPLKDVTAADKEDGDLTGKVEILDNSVDTSKAGVYEVTYKVTDSQGASSIKTIKVTVKAKDAPPTPDESNKPGESCKQDEPEKQDNSNNTVVPMASAAGKTPETGDKAGMTLWTLLLIASGIGVIGACRKRRKTDQ